MVARGAAWDGIAAVEATIRSAAETWTEADWERASFCPGWSYKALLVHLLQVAELATDGIRRGLAGDGGPPADAADLLAWRAARRDRQQNLTHLSRDELLRAYDSAVAALHAAFADAARADPNLPAWHPAGTRTVAWWTPQWLFEVAIHDWDLRVTRDPSAEIDPRALPGLAPALGPRLARWFGADGTEHLSGTVRVAFADEPGARPTFRVAGRVLDVLTDGTAADAEIGTDTGAFALVSSYRRPFGYYVERGRWALRGDRMLAEGFSGGFKAV